MAKKLEKKFIGDDQVGSSQILIEKNVSLRGTTQADAVVDLLGLNVTDEVLLKGVKVLNSSGLIPADILPSYVDDVLEYADLAAFPVTGETGKIYVALDTNKCYRWSGSAYIQITSGAVDSVNGETGVVVLDAGDIEMVSLPGTSVETRLVDLENDKVAKAGDTMTGDLLIDDGAGNNAKFSPTEVTGSLDLGGGDTDSFLISGTQVQIAQTESSVSRVSQMDYDGVLISNPSMLASTAKFELFKDASNKAEYKLDEAVITSPAGTATLSSGSGVFHNAGDGQSSAGLGSNSLNIYSVTDAKQLSFTTASGQLKLNDGGVTPVATLPVSDDDVAVKKYVDDEIAAVSDDVSHLVTLSGVAVDSDDLGSFTGTTIPDAQTIKQALQALETAHEELDQNANDLITLSGVAENAVNLGAFTGSTIPDDQTIKQALQSLETAVETKVSKAGDTMTGFLTLHDDPTAPLHAATKQYVDAVAEGLHVHAPARLLAAVDLGGTYNNGTAGVGAFLDFSASPIAGIDGVSSFAAGDRIIVALQNGSSLDPENGVYYIASAGDIDGNGDITKLTRAVDFDTPTEMAGGDFIFVQEGSLYADTGWVMTETVVTVGTTPVKFLQFSGAGSYSAGEALFLDGTEFNVLFDDSTIGLDGSNQLYVKDSGIGSDQIAADAVTKEKINSDVAGSGLTQAVDGSLQVNAGDGIEVALDAVKIKLDGSSLAVSASGLKSNISWVKDFYAVTSTLTTGAFFDLDFVAEVGSISAWVDRLAIHEGASEDYTVSYTGGAGGVTRITFVNALVTPGQSQLSNGDTVFFKYQKKDS